MYAHSSRLVWDKEKRCCLCRRCWRGEVGKYSSRQGKRLHPAFLFVAIFVSAFLPFSIVKVMDTQYFGELDEIETTNISALPESGTVRVEGTILADGNETVIDGKENSIWLIKETIHKWEFNDDERFLVSDGTGTVEVSTEGYYAIRKGNHSRPGSDGKVWGVYKGGDEVVIIGELDNNSENSTLQALVVYPKEKDRYLGNSAVNYGKTVLGVAIWLVPLTIVFLAFARRMRWHKKHVNGLTPVPLPTKSITTKQNLAWIKNREYVPDILRKKILVFVSLLGLALLIILVLFMAGDFHTRNEYFHFATYRCFPIFFLLVNLPAFVFFGYCDGTRKETGWNTNLLLVRLINQDINLWPNKVAVDEQGIHFHHEDPYVRYTEQRFVLWEKICGVAIKGNGYTVIAQGTDEWCGERLRCIFTNEIQERVVKQYKASGKPLDQDCGCTVQTLPGLIELPTSHQPAHRGPQVPVHPPPTNEDKEFGW